MDVIDGQILTNKGDNNITIDPTSYYTNPLINRFSAKIIIGKYTSIAKNFTVIHADHASIHKPCVSNYSFAEFKQWDYPKGETFGTFEIGNDVLIGENVTLVSPLKIGDGAIIGAGAVVAKSVKPYTIMVGNPARLLRYRFDIDNIGMLEEIKWWDWSEEKIKEAMPYMKDVDEFLNNYYD